MTYSVHTLCLVRRHADRPMMEKPGEALWTHLQSSRPLPDYSDCAGMAAMFLSVD